MDREFDCVICGETCIDLTVRPIDRGQPLKRLGTLRVEPIQAGTGGIVPNSGTAMARMGMHCAAFGCVGDDHWATFLTERLAAAGLDTQLLLPLRARATSATAVLVDHNGEHTFAFHPGASAGCDASVIQQHISVFARSRYALFGYYGLMPHLESELAGIMQQVQSLGCRTALDSAAGGGTLSPLDQILPWLDVYVPSFDEAKSQTGCDDPEKMIRTFREYAPKALLGVKLGAGGALLSSSEDHWIRVAAVKPPGNIVDTTGAGDCFYAGLICGLVRGMTVEDAGKLGAAAGACSVTMEGATAGLPEWSVLSRMSEGQN